MAEARPPSPAVLRRRREALAEVRDVVARLMSGGLSHLGPDDAESLGLLAGRVRLAGFDRVGTVRFDGLLRVAGGQVAGLAGRDDAVTESDLLDTFAEVWGMCEVLQRTLDGAVTGTDAQRAPGGSRAGAGDRAGAGGGASREWVSATGKDADDEITVDRWVPLGVRWWTSQSGSRGLAYLGWDAGAGPDAASDPASDLASDLASDPASDPASDLASDPASDQASDAVSPAASDAGIGPSSRNRSDVDAGARTGPDVGTRPGVGTGPDVGAALGAHQDARSTTPAGHAGGRVRQVVTGRPAGTDLRFRRSWTSPSCGIGP
nr:hypothetical protein GCM10025730_49340 [Promicromonospora thailandica]